MVIVAFGLTKIFFSMIGQDHAKEYLADTNALNTLQAPVEITEAIGERWCC
jgi:hypothetical protein